MRPAAIVLVCMLIGGSVLGIGAIGLVAWNAAHRRSTVAPAPAVADKLEASPSDLASHPFWRKPLSEQRIETILELMVEGRNGELWVDQNGSVWDRMETTLREAGAGKVAAIVGTGFRPRSREEAIQILGKRLDHHLQSDAFRAKVKQLQNP